MLVVRFPASKEEYTPMSSTPFLSRWLKYLVKRDTVSKMMLGASVGIGIFWYLKGFDQELGKSTGVAFLASILFSFLFYITVGRIQERSEHKFYDAIYTDCDWTAPYKGRNMKRIKVDWFLVWAKSVSILAESNSRVVTSSSGWRSAKLSVSDSFIHRGNHILTSFAGHRQGRLTFTFLKDEEAETRANREALLEGGLYEFAYENLYDYGNELPKVSSMRIGNDAKDEPLLETARIEFTKQVTNYDRNHFEANYRQRYENPSVLWAFKWDYSSVEITAVPRGSSEERRLQGSKVIASLVASSARRAFSLYSDDEYLFNEGMVRWSQDGKRIDSLTVDFLQSDVSADQRAREFETQMIQGLDKLFKDRSWEFDWNVDAFEQTVTISHKE